MEGWINEHTQVLFTLDFLNASSVIGSQVDSQNTSAFTPVLPQTTTASGASECIQATCDPIAHFNAKCQQGHIHTHANLCKCINLLSASWFSIIQMNKEAPKVTSWHKRQMSGQIPEIKGPTLLISSFFLSFLPSAHFPRPLWPG